MSPGCLLEVLAALPPHGNGVSSLLGADFASLSYAEVREWKETLDRLDIRLPEQRLIEILKSNLGYILLNQDGPRIKPGPRNYNHAWIRDGAMTAEALLRAGLFEPAKSYAQAYTGIVREDGWVPYIVFEGVNPVGFNSDLDQGEGHEYDSQGEYNYLIRQLGAFCGRDTVSSDMVEKVIASVRFMQKLRRLRMTDAYRQDPEKQAYFGIFPASNSHEGTTGAAQLPG